MSKKINDIPADALSEMEKAARNFALQVHAGQLYGDKPYHVHLDHVHRLACQAQLPAAYRIAAYLHDCMEDSPDPEETGKKIAGLFGQEVFNLVWSVSGTGNSRKARTQDTLKKLAEFPGGIDLKMIDRLANMQASKMNNSKLFTMYVKEFALYEELFIQGNAWVYHQMKELLSEPQPRHRI